jgi:hypothetical protein
VCASDEDLCFSQLWEDSLANAGLTGDRYAVRTKSGYDLTLVRIVNAQ